MTETTLHEAVGRALAAEARAQKAEVLLAPALEALHWIAEKHPRVMREMPTETYQALRLAGLAALDEQEQA